MGVFYDVRVHLAENPDDYVGKRRTKVFMGIRKTQCTPPNMKPRFPTATTEKSFMCGSGIITLEANLDRDLFFHGEEIPVHIAINNQSKKAVKAIRVNFELKTSFFYHQVKLYCIFDGIVY